MGHVKETPQATSVTPNKCYQLQTAVGELWDAVSQDEIRCLGDWKLSEGPEEVIRSIRNQQGNNCYLNFNLSL